MEPKQFRILIMIIAFFCLLTMMNTCNSCSAKRKLSTVETKINSFESSCVNKTDIFNMTLYFEKSLKIEGLKSEHRMIQSTDRKILDIQRQNDIEKEIQTLQTQNK